MSFESVQHTEAPVPNIDANGDVVKSPVPILGQGNQPGSARSTVHTGATRVQLGGGGSMEVTQMDRQAYHGEQTGEHSPYEVDPTSIVSNIGQAKAISAVLEDSDRIRVGGVETTVVNAERSGLIQRGTDGRLLDSVPQADPKPEPGAAPGDPTRTHTADFEARDHHIPQAPQDYYQEAALAMLSEMDTTAAAAVKKAVFENSTKEGLLEQVAQALGVSEDGAVDYINHVYDGVHSLGNQALDMVGVVDELREDFAEWGSKLPGDRSLVHAFKNIVNFGNADQVAALGKRYISELDQRHPQYLMDSLKNSGFKGVRYDTQRKQVLLQKDGVEMSWHSAYLSGAVGTPVAAAASKGD